MPCQQQGFFMVRTVNHKSYANNKKVHETLKIKINEWIDMIDRQTDR